MAGVLEGIKVLELSIYHAGPAAARMLADMGAEVIKIEDTEGGDPTREITAVLGSSIMTAKGSSAPWECYNRNKKSISVNLKKREGQQIIYALTPHVDVFLTGFTNPTVKKLGMDYDTLRRYNPKLVYAHVSAFGARGPEADLPGADWTGQARGGMLLAQRGPDEEPWSRLGLADQMGAISTAFGVLGALVARERLGIGQKVESSLAGGILWLLTRNLNVTLTTGREPGPHSREQAGNPLHNTYRCGDNEWLCLSIGFGQDVWWPRFCQAIERPDLEHDPRFHDLNAREQNRNELIPVLDGIFLRRPRDEWLQRFADWDCLAAPVTRLSELSSDPQVIANEYIIEYDDPVLGKQKVVGFPNIFSETPMSLTSLAPECGQHTEEVLLRLGRFAPDDLAKFQKDGVIRQK